MNDQPIDIRYTSNKTILLHAFPQMLANDIDAVFPLIPWKKYSFSQGAERVFHLADEQLHIPYRVYFDEPSTLAISQLTPQQQVIIHCIYLRHHDGFIRQKHLEWLGERSEYWTAPYLLLLLGEYVYEILEVLNRLITKKNIQHFNLLAKENPKLWQQTESRVISYWNEYYRHGRPGGFPDLQQYLGKQIIDRIRRFQRFDN